MTLQYLLDTGIVSAPVSRVPDQAILERLDEHGPECAIAAPVWHELTYGCSRLPKGKRRAALEAYLRTVVRVSFHSIQGIDRRELGEATSSGANEAAAALRQTSAG